MKDEPANWVGMALMLIIFAGVALALHAIR
jgi:hypothetical protein